MDANTRMLTVLAGSIASLILPGLVAGAEQGSDESVRPVQINDDVTRLEYADGTVKSMVQGRKEPAILSGAFPITNPEPAPFQTDTSRGYLLFVPEARVGYVPEYRPAKSKLRRVAKICASPGEYEFVTFGIRPRRDLGQVRYEVGPFEDADGFALSDLTVDQYVIEPTVEQTGVWDETCRWAAKWLRPTNTRTALKQMNMQMVVDELAGKVPTTSLGIPQLQTASVTDLPRLQSACSQHWWRMMLRQ